MDDREVLRLRRRNQTADRHPQEVSRQQLRYPAVAHECHEQKERDRELAEGLGVQDQTRLGAPCGAKHGYHCLTEADSAIASRPSGQCGPQASQERRPRGSERTAIAANVNDRDLTTDFGSGCQG